MLETLQPSKSPFRPILIGSIVLHVGFLAVTYASWMYGVALKFGSIEWDAGGEAKYYEKAVMIDRSKPLYMPDGFYAVEKPPEEIVKREEPKTEEEPEEKEQPKDEAEEETGEEVAKTEEPAEPDKPAGEMKFGRISGNALKPHIQQVYTAYERGLVDVDTFSVTVSCTAEPDGSLSNIRVVKSSGSDLIDKTAVNLFRELGAMQALAPLSALSSVSLTLDVGPSSSALTAVGFADSPGVSQDFANQLGLLAFGAKFQAATPDQKALVENIKVTQSGNRVSVRLNLPNSAASDMMRRNFGSRDTVGA